ncbi:MAG: isoprenylcysteine carboxylmethyltransferase family protein [Ignavibacteriae bacterium]|jgi:protein-S-isoprenylcysteine O-methyltransferase Ste14|nr:isoprenylcysteine carboxylmethyltransferase family protein [Ignavibacteriota bacterium]NOG96957.1 isoprenylcysteine carboxylmethyltransferase family protein [Ignavibacteriota bacterium]
MASLSDKVFKYRSYSPIPFVILMLVFQNADVQSLLIGFAITLTGELIRLWGVSYAGSETRTTGAVGGTYLIISGPFAYVKNPLYLGNILMYFGFGIMSMALFPYLQIFALFFFYFQYHVIIKREEGYLREQFGEEYSKYYKAVPKLIPTIFPYRNKNLEQPAFDLKAGLRSERRTLQAFAITTLLLLAVWYFELNKF